MNVKFYRPARLLSFVLAATVALAPAAMAADTGSVLEQDVAVTAVNEQDAPVIVSSALNGTALGVGSVEVLGVNVRENPNMDAEVVGVIGQDQQVLVLSKDGDWYRVTSSDGVTGFVHSDYMQVADTGSGDLGYGLVKCAAANIRSMPDTESEPISCLGEEEVVTITGIENGWYQVALSDGTGYVRSDLVDPTAPIPAEKLFNYAVVKCTAANLRSEPDSAADRTDTLYSGSLCTLVQQVGDWYEVQYGDTTGYVLASLVDVTNDETEGSDSIETLNEAVERERQEAEEAAAAAAAAAQQAAESASAAADETPAYEAPAETPAYEEPASAEPSYDEPAYEEPEEEEPAYEEPSYEEPEEEPAYEEPSYSSAGDEIVSVAKQYLGVPYVWGGTTPSGFDCSGFVQYVFRQCGYSISRTATPQYSDGYAVSYSNLQPGDLVFFERTYNDTGITHVGIYIGGGQFIHAGGGCVKISYLSESYYSSRYYGACRIA